MMVTPAEVGGWIAQNIWIVGLILWIMILFGVGGTILSFVKWLHKGTRELFNPVFLIILIILIILSLIVWNQVTNLF